MDILIVQVDGHPQESKINLRLKWKGEADLPGKSECGCCPDGTVPRQVLLLPCAPRLGRDGHGAHWHPNRDQTGELLTTHSSAMGLSWGLQQEG